MSAAVKKQQREGLSRNVQKWTQTMMDAGWSILPNVILERQQALGLDAVDVNIILHLVRHWWFAENLPHPSKKTIAECMGIDESTVRRHIARLEAGGYIKRKYRFNGDNEGQQTNEYDLTGLIVAARPYAEEIIQTKRRRQREDADRRLRKQPRLAVVGAS